MFLATSPVSSGALSPSGTFAEKAFLTLRADILAGRLRPGEKMNVERLKDVYGVGATPLREALSRLSSMELVVAEGQKGFRVAPVSLRNLLDITKTRAWIETVALQAAIARGTTAWEASIMASLHRLEGCSSADGQALSDDWYRENRAFHDALVATCDSAQLMAFRAQLYDLSDRYRRLSVVEGTAGRDLDAEHRTLMAAVLGRDAATASRLVEDHFIETTFVILKGESGLPASPEEIIQQLRQDIRAGLASRPTP